MCGNGNMENLHTCIYMRAYVYEYPMHIFSKLTKRNQDFFCVSSWNLFRSPKEFSSMFSRDCDKIYFIRYKLDYYYYYYFKYRKQCWNAWTSQITGKRGKMVVIK